MNGIQLLDLPPLALVHWDRDVAPRLSTLDKRPHAFHVETWLILPSEPFFPQFDTAVWIYDREWAGARFRHYEHGWIYIDSEYEDELDHLKACHSLLSALASNFSPSQPTNRATTNTTSV